MGMAHRSHARAPILFTHFRLIEANDNLCHNVLGDSTRANEADVAVNLVVAMSSYALPMGSVDSSVEEMLATHRPGVPGALVRQRLANIGVRDERQLVVEVRLRAPQPVWQARVRQLMRHDDGSRGVSVR